jgi:hypothetical protein
MYELFLKGRINNRWTGKGQWGAGLPKFVASDTVFDRKQLDFSQAKSRCGRHDGSGVSRTFSRQN